MNAAHIHAALIKEMKMKFAPVSMLSIAAFTSVFSLSACTGAEGEGEGEGEGSSEGEGEGEGEQPNTIVDVAAAAGDFTVLVGALQSTGLDETLRGEGPFTVFAPTDDAFALLPDGVVAGLDEETLSAILTYHVVSGDVRAADVIDAAPFSPETVNGANINIALVDADGDNDAEVIINGVVQVTTTDIVADNGVIHVIDAVLLPIDYPGTIVDAVVGHPILSTLAGAVVTAELDDDLAGSNGSDGFTLFAPINAAFVGLTLPTDVSELANILTYHVVADTVDAATVITLDGSTATTLQTSTIDIDVVDGGVVLNNEVNVLYTDIFASNGVIHVLDGVLLPPAP